MLPAEDTANRIRAARLLRGMSQDDLSQRLREAGLPARLVGALERGEVQMRPAHLHALSDALGFPERWFQVPVDELCVELPDQAVRERLGVIEGQLGDLLLLVRRLSEQ